MFREEVRWLVVVLVSGLALPANAAPEVEKVIWHDDVSVAWQASQSQNRPLLVFVTRADCLPCAKMKVGTYKDRGVAETINRRFVALWLDAARPSPLLKDLAVKAIPATFVISPDAVILQRTEGFISAEQMTARLATIPSEKPAEPKIRTISERAF